MRISELGIIIGCVVALAVVALTQLTAPALEQAPAPVVQPVDTAIVETEGPVTYYISNCSRCHGDPDTAYPDVKAHHRDESLRKMIREMSNGPGAAPIEEPEVEEQFRLHNAMFDHKPFVWIDRSRKDVIAGEVIPGTTVRAGNTQAKLEDHRFVLTPTKGPIVATRAGVSVSIKQ